MLQTIGEASISVQKGELLIDKGVRNHPKISEVIVLKQISNEFEEF